MIEYIVASFIYLCIAFIAAATLKNRLENTKVKPLVRIFLIPFIIGDWLWNLIGGTVVFLDPPERLFELTTGRMKRYKLNYGYVPRGVENYLIESWRYGFAVQLCKFLSKFDNGHC